MLNLKNNKKNMQETIVGDISLISSMYPDETVILENEVIFTVKPSVDYGVHSLL